MKPRTQASSAGPGLPTFAATLATKAQQVLAGLFLRLPSPSSSQRRQPTASEVLVEALHQRK
ncbi:MAG: hypothetical protein MIL41_28490 [Hyphomicrobiales bacterium]